MIWSALKEATVEEEDETQCMEDLEATQAYEEAEAEDLEATQAYGDDDPANMEVTQAYEEPPVLQKDGEAQFNKPGVKAYRIHITIIDM